MMQNDEYMDFGDYNNPQMNTQGSQNRVNNNFNGMQTRADKAWSLKRISKHGVNMMIYVLIATVLMATQQTLCLIGLLVAVAVLESDDTLNHVISIFVTSYLGITLVFKLITDVLLTLVVGILTALEAAVNYKLSLMILTAISGIGNFTSILNWAYSIICVVVALLLFARAKKDNVKMPEFLTKLML